MDISLRGELWDNDSADVLRFWGWRDITAPMDIAGALERAGGEDVDDLDGRVVGRADGDVRGDRGGKGDAEHGENDCRSPSGMPVHGRLGEIHQESFSR